LTSVIPILTIFLVNILRANARPADFGQVTPVEFEILLSLAEGDRHGYAIMQEVSERSEGAVTVRPGTLYRAISRLLEAGLVAEVSRAASRGRGADDERRRYYSLTTLGRRVAAIEARRLARQVSTARARKLLESEG
jgi:DNA-binding PadR family transcriptional regulator